MQRAYWDRVAPSYRVLYRDSWSSLEEAAVIERLRRCLPGDVPTVLDLGCGVGLGHDLIAQAVGRDPDYHGIDISEAMLHISRERLPAAEFVGGSMSNLGGFPDDRFDCVTAFFATASYAEVLEALLGSVARVLRPGGVAYLSFLGRWSFRRLVRGRVRSLERYHTRHERGAPPPLVRSYTPQALAQAVKRQGNLNLITIEGQGFLSGVAESPALWSISEAVDRRAPSLSHLLEVVMWKAGEP
jgi:ubiquinone/menaquinone biosynthesis C-methylase UbiE